LTMSTVTNRGTPIAAMRISARRQCAAMSRFGHDKPLR
jgi:hypothetical protein